MDTNLSNTILITACINIIYVFPIAITIRPQILLAKDKVIEVAETRGMGHDYIMKLIEDIHVVVDARSCAYGIEDFVFYLIEGSRGAAVEVLHELNVVGGVGVEGRCADRKRVVLGRQFPRPRPIRTCRVCTATRSIGNWRPSTTRWRRRG